MSSAGYVDPVLALAQAQQPAAQPAAPVQGIDPVLALSQQHGLGIPVNTSVSQGTPPLGLAADIAHQVPLMDKAAAAVAATFPSLSPLSVHAGSWGDRYHGTLTNIRNGLAAYENDNHGGAQAAKAAGVIGPMLVGAGEASPLINTLKGSAIGGAYGFSGTNDTSLPDDLMATGEGAGLGAASAGAGHLVGSAIGSGAGRVVDAVTGTSQTKGQRLAAAMLMDKMSKQGVTAPDLISQLSGHDRPVTMMDIGGENAPLQRLGRTMVTLPGDQAQEITSFLNNRQEGQRGRVLNDISQLAPNTNTYDMAADLRTQRSVESDPLYQQAFANAPITTDRLSQFHADPDIQQGYAQGIKIQRRLALAHGEPFDPNAYAITQFNEAGDPIIGPVPTWRTLHAGRMGLDDMIYSQADPLTGKLPDTQAMRSLQALRGAFSNHIQELNPDLKAADAAWSTPSQNLDAMNRGQTFMRADPEQIELARGRLTPEADTHYQTGAGRAMRDVANDTSDNRNIPMRLTGDQTARDQIGSAFGAQPALDFTNRMGLEKQLTQTRNFITGNSSTANKAADVADMNDPGLMHQILSDVIKGGVTGGLHGALALPAINIANRTGNKFISGLMNNEDRNLELAKVLTAHGPNAGQDISALLTPAQNRARLVNVGKNVGGALGRGAGSLLIPALMAPPAN